MTGRKSKAEGVDATNRDYIDYEQVLKHQAYAFSEQPGRERYDEDFVVETCDLGRWLHGDAAERQAFAEELGNALEDIGFAILVGHGVDPALYEEAAEEVVRLFEDHTLEEKLRFRAARHGAVNQGYFPLRETTDIHPDRVEGWVFCRRAFDLDPAAPARLEDFWPDPAHERVFRRLCRAQTELVLPVARSILTFLACDPHLLDRPLERPSFGLRLNHYPPVSGGPDDGDRAGRLLGHEDVDLFTLLPAPRSEGLQVLDRRTFRWIRLDAPPGSIVLNTGDYMQRITNDLLPSTTHRVALPLDPAERARTRVSFPLNVYLPEDEVLAVLPGLGPARYEPVRALEFHTRTTAKYYGDDHAVEGPS
jgi:isopenicillin N synthase-like dioxygenase